MFYLAQYWFVPLVLAFVLMALAMKIQYDNVRKFNFNNMQPVIFLALFAVFNAVLFIVGLAGYLVGVPKPVQAEPPAPTSTPAEKHRVSKLIKPIEKGYYATIWRNEQRRYNNYN